MRTHGARGATQAGADVYVALPRAGGGGVRLISSVQAAGGTQPELPKDFLKRAASHTGSPAVFSTQKKSTRNTSHRGAASSSG